MTGPVMIFVQSVKDKHSIKGNVLDVGSLDVNGCLRPIFEDSNYIGLDMRAGDNVDVVANAHNISSEDNFFDCVCCVEMLEHDEDFFRSITEMKRVLKPGGWLIIATPSIGFSYHPYPKDYWRFTEDSFALLLNDLDQVFVKAGGSHVFGCGQKKGD